MRMRMRIIYAHAPCAYANRCARCAHAADARSASDDTTHICVVFSVVYCIALWYRLGTPGHYLLCCTADDDADAAC